MKRQMSIFLVCLAVCLAGCPRGRLVEIGGRITLDGVPLENGTIDFRPADGRGPTAGAIVKQGRYSVEVVPGPKKVEILGYKKVGQQHITPNDPSSLLVDVNEQIVPERYNTETELTCKIDSGGGTHDFALESR